MNALGRRGARAIPSASAPIAAAGRGAGGLPEWSRRSSGASGEPPAIHGAPGATSSGAPGTARVPWRPPGIPGDVPQAALDGSDAHPFKGARQDRRGPPGGRRVSGRGLERPKRRILRPAREAHTRSRERPKNRQERRGVESDSTLFGSLDLTRRWAAGLANCFWCLGGNIIVGMAPRVKHDTHKS